MPRRCGLSFFSISRWRSKRCISGNCTKLLRGLVNQDFDDDFLDKIEPKASGKIEAKVPPWGFQCFVESLGAQQRAYLDKSGVRDCIQEVMKAVLEEKREASDAVQFLIECFDQIRIQPRLQELRPVQTQLN